MTETDQRPRRPDDFPLMPDPCALCGKKMQQRPTGHEGRTGILPMLGVPVHGGHGRCKKCAERRNPREPRVDAEGFWIEPPIRWPDILFGPMPQFVGAACAGAPDPEVFHEIPAGGHIPPAALMAAAQFCAHCPVRAACGADADENHARGLWGGSWRTGRPTGYRVRSLLDLLPDPAAAVVPTPAAAASPPTTRKAIA